MAVACIRKKALAVQENTTGWINQGGYTHVGTVRSFSAYLLHVHSFLSSWTLILDLFL